MAISYKAGQRSAAASAARSGRRVSLARPGGPSSPAKNRRLEPKRAGRGQSRAPALPWPAIGHAASTFGLLALMVIILGGVALGLLYGYRSLTSGAYFALKTLEIQGNSRLNSREILETADLIDGANTLALSIDDVEAALSAHPWVEQVSVKRVLPGTLIIKIRERVPAFWMLHEGSLQYADARGRIIGPVRAGHFASLPTLEVEAGAAETAEALPDLVRSLHEARLLQGLGAMTMLRLSSDRSVELYVEGARLKLCLGLEEWLANLRRMDLTLKDLQRRDELAGIREIRAQGSSVWVETSKGS